MTFRLIFLLCGLLLLFSACVQPCAPDPRSKKALDVETFLKNTQVPEFRFENVEIREAMSTLVDFSLSGRDTFRLNIVCLWPPEVDSQSPKLTLNVRDVSAWKTLQMMCELSGLMMRIERNVVLIDHSTGAKRPRRPPLLTGPRFNAEIEHKLDAVFVRELCFNKAEISDAISFLMLAMRQSDTSPAPETESQSKPEAPEPYPFGIVMSENGDTTSASKILPTVSFGLRDVSILDALHLCLHLTGLSYRISDGNIEILAPE
jgi:hypothetical protein